MAVYTVGGLCVIVYGFTSYQSQLYMDTWREREAGGIKGRYNVWMNNVREDMKEKNID